jgi:hypothetical protein
LASLLSPYVWAAEAAMIVCARPILIGLGGALAKSHAFELKRPRLRRIKSRVCARNNQWSEQCAQVRLQWRRDGAIGMVLRCGVRALLWVGVARYGAHPLKAVPNLQKLAGLPTRPTGWPFRDGQRRSRIMRMHDTSPAIANSSAF